MRFSDWSSDVCSSDLVCLTRIVERMLSAYADTFASRRLILDARLQPDIFVLAGEDLLETVLENIFDNAIEVSPNGSKIIVELRSVQGRAELSVLDRGPDRKSVV